MQCCTPPPVCQTMEKSNTQCSIAQDICKISEPTSGYSAVPLIILGLSDSTSPFGYKQNKLLTEPRLPIRDKPASRAARKATRSSLKLRRANDIQTSTWYSVSGCCSLPQQSIFSSLHPTDIRINRSGAHPHPQLRPRIVARKQDFQFFLFFSSAQRPRDPNSGTSLGSRIPCDWRSCTVTTLMCMQATHGLKSLLDSCSSGCILLSRVKNFAIRGAARGFCSTDSSDRGEASSKPIRSNNVTRITRAKQCRMTTRTQQATNAYARTSMLWPHATVISQFLRISRYPTDSTSNLLIDNGIT
jgi:hypothetical protein